MTTAEICSEYSVNIEQARALDIESNVALRAGAGSGKTSVLTKRFVRCIIENKDWDLDNIVAITFTRKAATEMKDRIRRELTDKANKSTDMAEKKRLSELKMRISESNINTIHGFCADILRRNFYLAAIDPSFDILEEVDKTVILDEIADKALKSYIEDTNNAKTIEMIAKNLKVNFFSNLRKDFLKAYSSIKTKCIDANDFALKFKSGDSSKKDLLVLIQDMALDVISAIDKGYSEFKLEKNLLDFTDLEIESEKLLKNEEIRDACFARFRTLLIDEFQDVNPIQRRIVSLLASMDGVIPHGRLFIVGDHKQSIYGFRGSDYRIFEEVCSDIAGYGKVELLSSCYRSSKTLIEMTNKTFEHLIVPFEKLKPCGNNDKTERKAELYTWDKDKIKEWKTKSRWESAKNFISDENKADELKAVLYDDYNSDIVQNKEMLQAECISGVILKLKKMGYNFGDIAILLRSRRNILEIEKSLRNNDITYCVLGGLGFWDRFEISDILAIYKLIFFADDKFSFYTALRSPIFSFSDDMIVDLSALASSDKELNPINLLEYYASTSNENSQIIDRAFTILKQLLPLAGVLNSIELMQSIIKITGYEEILTLQPDGERKLRNLEKLIEIVENFEQKENYGAKELIRYIDFQSTASENEGEAFIDNEDSDAVKILTIHKAKGLEFKAVIIPDMNKELDKISKTKKPMFYVDETEGLVGKGFDKDEKSNDITNPKYAALYDKKLQKENEDNIRLFYVAVTRAIEYLALIGENQEIKVSDGVNQNSFMKQLRYAMFMAGSIEEIAEFDAFSVLPVSTTAGNSYPPTFFAKAEEMLKEEVISKDLDKNLLPLNCDSEGSFSISSVFRFRACPRRYYFENLARLKEENSIDDPVETAYNNLTPTQAGTILHSVLEHTHTDIEAEKLLLIIKNSAASDGLLLNSNDSDFFAEAAQGFSKIEKERSQNFKGKLRDSLREYSFRVPLSKGIYLNGYIDRIDIYENEGKLTATVIDYKSSRKSAYAVSDTNLAENREQVLIYAWALSQIPFYEGSKVDLNELVIYYLNHGKAYSYTCSKDDFEDILDSIKDHVPFILGNKPFKEYDAVKGHNCDWCANERFCR